MHAATASSLTALACAVLAVVGAGAPLCAFSFNALLPPFQGLLSESRSGRPVTSERTRTYAILST